MAKSRPVFPGKFLFITRRCTQRQFLLRPDEVTNVAAWNGIPVRQRLDGRCKHG